MLSLLPSLLDEPIRCRFPGDITEDGLSAFEEKFFKDELTPTLKSEEPAEEDMAEPVKVLKGKTFAKHVLESGESKLFLAWFRRKRR